MPSTLHEALIQMFRRRPLFVAELLGRSLGIPLPAFQDARLDSGELTQLIPTEYRADAVVVLGAGGASVLAVVIEIQLGRDLNKQWSWPVYLTTLRARLRCPTMLLVVCVEASVAGWCAAPIDLGHPGWALRPLVLAPDQVPLVTDGEQASREPELAVLSAVAHGGQPDGEKVLYALVSALAAVDEEHALLYSDVVLAALPTAAQRYLEGLMATRTYEYQSDFARRYFFQGRAEGEAGAVLAVLDARGISIPDEARTRIAGCADLDQLDAWIRRAATADTVNDLFV